MSISRATLSQDQNFNKGAPFCNISLGSCIATISDKNQDGPTACFVISKNRVSSASIARLTSCRGTDNEEIQVTWDNDQNIPRFKVTSNKVSYSSIPPKDREFIVKIM
jgi:hypothetical protein